MKGNNMEYTYSCSNLDISNDEFPVCLFSFLCSWMWAVKILIIMASNWFDFLRNSGMFLEYWARHKC